MVTANGHLKILDFGLAKPRQSKFGETSISMEGYVAGTYAAMSPEQIQG
jgi:serine/threonine protein kinase